MLRVNRGINGRLRERGNEMQTESKKQVLIAVDDPKDREALKKILSDRYAVYETKNCGEGLAILNERRESIALVILDTAIPAADRRSLLYQMKEEPGLSAIPVIVMTDRGNLQEESDALAHGAAEVIAKPCNPETLQNRAERIINLREMSVLADYFKYDRFDGIYSKEFFYKKVKEYIDSNPDAEYNIICSDIEDFKIFKSHFGRDESKRILKEAACLMLNMSGDVGICGRYEEDCFVCLQKREGDSSDRLKFFEKLHHECQDRFGTASVKWGIYEIKDPSVDVEMMCDYAKLAVNHIKGQYDRYMAVYDESMLSKKLREQNITNALDAALGEEQMTVYYQPKYDLQNGELVGVEALARWTHPELGNISPGEFIPLFEKNGSIYRIDQYIWEHVCAKLGYWRDKGYSLVPVSVNISRADLYILNLIDVFEKLTEKYSIDPACLQLEITESAYTQNPGKIIDTVKELWKRKFTIAMDDFGSGYSSLNMFSQMKTDILKLDMKFVQSETQKDEKLSILNDIINMAHRMGMKVVAEGIERKEQAERLKNAGCDYAQGYFFSKPMPSDEFEKLLKKER